MSYSKSTNVLLAIAITINCRYSAILAIYRERNKNYFFIFWMTKVDAIPLKGIYIVVWRVILKERKSIKLVQCTHLVLKFCCSLLSFVIS